MYFPRFLVGMLATSVVVAAWVYLDTGSIGKGLMWGVIAAFVVQAGYFALVFGLVYGRRDTEQDANEAVPDATKRPIKRAAAPPQGRA